MKQIQPNPAGTDRGMQAPRNAVSLMYRYYKYVLPVVREELSRWRSAARAIPDPELRAQALASLEAKRFHCEGGAIYAAAEPAWRGVLVPLIVALQTISDYLDNLCDRSTSLDADDFRLLHRSMLDAVIPDAPLHDYYALRRERDDGGYLHGLVRTCQSCVAALPGYGPLSEDVSRLVGLYGDLQVYKHIRHEERMPQLQAWWHQYRDDYPDLRWNEFAAATGSTLGMFMLFTAACRTGLGKADANRIRQAYFPHVCGLHIMLDYLIDQEEDRNGGDLNFCSYYENGQVLADRLVWLVEGSRERVRLIPHAGFHRMIIEGLIAVYLSDPKARRQECVRYAARRLMKRSPWTRLFFWGNVVWVRSRKND